MTTTTALNDQASTPAATASATIDPALINAKDFPASSLEKNNLKDSMTTTFAPEDCYLECGTSLAEQEYQLDDTKKDEETNGFENQQPAHSIQDNAMNNHESKSLSTTSRRQSKATTDLLHFLGIAATASSTTASTSSASAKTVQELRECVAQNVITQQGTLTTFTSPWEDPSAQPPVAHNRRRCRLELPLVYADHTASNRPLQVLEDYLQRVALPLYGNTHTNTSVTGSQSTALVAEARQIVAEACNAKITGKASLDVVLFAGQGATSAVQLLIDGMGLRHNHGAVRGSSSSTLSSSPLPPAIVFCGPYEHHSNLIPWREAGCRIIMIPEKEIGGGVDLNVLEHHLQQTQQQYPHVLRMGTFSAASNVTGKLVDTQALAILLHKYGALAFFDYATAAPYVEMDMNPTMVLVGKHGGTTNGNNNQEDESSFMLSSPIPINAAYKDAMFISPHKCLGGGAGTPGILICKKHLLSQVNAPQRSGGGTVFYVTHTDHRFLSNRLERYEGGTPHVVGIWRTGLVFRFKQQIELAYRRIVARSSAGDKGIDTTNATADSEKDSQAKRKDQLPRTLLEYEFQTFEKVASFWKKEAPNLVLLGHDEQPFANDGELNAESSKPRRNLPIFSFLIRCGDRFLHYNYVCAILNDVFGIQSRGGCQCAGPYSQRLLGLTLRVGSGKNTEELPNETNRRLEDALVKYKERAELLRPGYTRLSLPFKGMRQSEVDYVMRAVAWVAKNGWALMCQYRCNHRTGEWRHFNRQGKPLGREERRWLSHFLSPSDPVSASENDSIDMQTFLKQTMENADRILDIAKADQTNIRQSLKLTNASFVLDDLEDLRWYIYPQECARWLSSHTEPECNVNVKGPLDPCRTKIHSDTSSRSESEGKTNASDFDRKRKAVSVSATSESSIPPISSTSKVGHLGDNTLNFRNGLISGSASLSELDERIRAGELSSECQILNRDSGEWVMLRAILGATKKPKIVSTATDLDDAQVQAKATFTKKEVRDSNTWGTGSMTAASVAVKSTSLSNASGEASCPGTKKSKSKHKKPPAKMMRLVNQAIFNWDMIENGDRLLLGLSGGKDSLSLLHCLLEFRRKMPIDFDLEVCTIDPMTTSFDPSPLIPYVESLGLKYHYIRDDIVARANTSGKDGKMVSSLCAFCARMKRGNLYSVARKNKCNKLVLAQHLDDCAESFMMSVMHNGFLRTMKANYVINEGDLSVIRPMVYCRESLMADFSKSSGLPVINENCPACFEEPKERARVKKLLSREELNYPNFYDNIRRSLIPLMHGDLEPILHGYTEDIVSKVRKRLVPANQQKRNISPVGTTAEEKKDNDGDNLLLSLGESKAPASSLSDASDEDLIRELARRKAERHRLAGAMGRMEDTSDAADRTAAKAAKAVCTIDGACSFFD